MSLNTLPLSYCTNVHPGTSFDSVLNGLRSNALPIRDRIAGDLGVGLWLARPVATELLDDTSKIKTLREFLDAEQLSCYTLNAFPFGDFHADRVKEQVYLPDWADPDRLTYTKDCARILAEIMPEGREGSISTVPLGFKSGVLDEPFMDASITQLLELATFLDDLHDETGKIIRLAIEPEPFCLIETTEEAVQFFERLYAAAADQSIDAIARQHLGLCYDVCHQAVEFEAIAASVEAIASAGIRINKAQLSCAIQIDDPLGNEPARADLAKYIEPRYMHQTFAGKDGRFAGKVPDLTTEILSNPPTDLQDADEWRVHFHVPVNAERVGHLGTTRAQLVEAIAALHALEYAPHLEVETYTWEVLPDASTDIVSGIAAELTATQALLDQQQA
ncbi:metabolite traffic protein EboE [Calycomorphotria hydatis]|uniref:Xylose isomerase-like TIM barrel n=1 Tax=Calycomorphotria hydatis TaxID=2528027 RepID=A0A517TDY8_9PLAN|nr:metabolite traffic protein EboE [Calycomorphotria hydatis]QDT66591.1 Xylose isomerase-like TIM barrel [Calycomorphotria hydatis]